MNQQFWHHADTLVKASQIVIDREQGSLFSEVPAVAYPLDLGFLDDMKGEGKGVEVWVGSTRERKVTGAIVTRDAMGDAVIKLLIGCTEEDG
ncbi:MAG TPA: inorganic pyrophosphatase, partial [Symbiobacteriaceae bacterium]|nr:inorganic pyrophosphatase [Symbiobacteriaceae bacterium]